MNSVTSFFLFMLENLQKHHAGNSQQAFFFFFFYSTLPRWHTCITFVRQKQKQAWSDVSAMACFARALAVQLGRSDAEKKPQLVTELLPGLLELFSNRGALLQLWRWFFFFFFSAEGKFLSNGCDCSSRARLAVVIGCFIVVSRIEEWQSGEEPVRPHRRDCTPPRRHTPWMHEKQKQREPWHKFK